MSRSRSGQRPFVDKTEAVGRSGKRCEACGGRGTVVGEDLGIVGMVGDDGTAIRIPCLCCGGTASPEAPARRLEQ